MPTAAALARVACWLGVIHMTVVLSRRTDGRNADRLVWCRSAGRLQVLMRSATRGAANCWPRRWWSIDDRNRRNSINSYRPPMRTMLAARKIRRLITNLRLRQAALCSLALPTVHVRRCCVGLAPCVALRSMPGATFVSPSCCCCCYWLLFDSPWHPFTANFSKRRIMTPIKWKCNYVSS